MQSALLLLVWVASLAAYEVKVRVFDDRGEAIVGAKITVFFVKQGKSGGVTGVSGSDGAFMADGKSTLGIDIIAECAGHYSSRADNLKNGMDHEVQMVLPRVLKPTALFALRDFWPKIPSPGQWYGFDFEAGDWVAPHGKGKTVDVLFRYTSDFKGWKDDVVDPVRREWVMAANKTRDESAKKEWSLEKFKAEHGKWDGVLQVAFPGKQEGAVEQKFISYNEMKMPHAAPVDGYVAALEFSANTYSYPNFRQDIGFFLRTRVRLDKDGNIASANYSKIHGDFVFYPADGKMNFTYYYNPMPNDRNLEFAPKKNLFPEDKKGAFVQSP